MPAHRSGVEVNLQGRLTGAQRSQVEAWRSESAREVMKQAPIPLLMIVVAYRVFLIGGPPASHVSGSWDGLAALLLLVSLVFTVPWLGNLGAWVRSGQDLRRGEVASIIGRLHGRRERLGAEVKGWRLRSIADYGLPLPVAGLGPEQAASAASILDKELVLFHLPRSGLIVLAWAVDRRTDLPAADLALTRAMMAAFGTTDDDQAANRAGLLGARQLGRLNREIVPIVVSAGGLLAATAGLLALMWMSDAADPVRALLLMPPAGWGALLLREAWRRRRALAGTPKVGRIDAVVTPDLALSGRGHRAHPSFTFAGFHLHVPEAAYRFMPPRTLCRLYIAPSGDLVAVDPLIDPAGEELALRPLQRLAEPPTPEPPRRHAENPIPMRLRRRPRLRYRARPRQAR